MGKMLTVYRGGGSYCIGGVVPIDKGRSRDVSEMPSE